MSKKAPERPSLAVSYQHMIDDLLAAIPDLPETNINLSRPTKGAAYGMLSRVYMSMGDYENALKYADMGLDGNAVILNYNDYAGDVLPPTGTSPEELWVQYSYNVSFRLSNDLLSQFDPSTDLRIAMLTKLNGNNQYVYGSIQGYNPNRGITYAEIYLNKAECLARKGDIDGALEIVNEDIRKNRFDPADYEPLTAANKEEAIGAVLAERRRELAFKGIRWSDMKRLDADNRMPTVNRYANDDLTVIGSLQPHSAGYTFQIPLSVQAFNPDMPLNNR